MVVSLRDFDPIVTALARPRSNCTVNYRSILSSERAPHTRKLTIVNTEKESGQIQMRARHQDRLADWLSVIT
jgi:hypothetical protein